MSTQIETFRMLQDVQDVHNWLFDKKQESRCLEMMTPPELSPLLAAFFTEAKKSDGSDYDVEHLVLLRHSIDTYLQRRHYGTTLSDPAFEATQAALEARGGGKRPEIDLKRLSVEDEEAMWEKKYFGNHDGEALNCTLLYYFTKFFDLKTKNEHKELCFGDVVLRSGEGNIRFLEFDPRLTRGTNEEGSNQRASALTLKLQDTFEPKLVFQGGLPERDPVLLFESLIQHRPFRTRRPHTPMYLQPVLIQSSSAREWFEEKQLSTKSLNRIIKCISRGGKVSRKRTGDCQSSVTEAEPPLADEDENEAEREPEIVTVEDGGQVSANEEHVHSDEVNVTENDFGYDDEVNSIMSSNAGTLVPADGRSTDLQNLSPGSRLEFTGNFGQDTRDYARDYSSGQSANSDLPFSLLDVLRDDLTSLRTPSDSGRTLSPLLHTPHPMDTGLGTLGPGIAPRSYGQEPFNSRLTGRSRLQGRLQAIRNGPPEPRSARDSWRYRGGAEDIRASRAMTAYQPRSVRWSSQEDLYSDPYEGRMSPRPAIGYGRDGSDRYSPDSFSRRDDYVHNTQRRIDEAIARRERPSRLRPDRTSGRRYQTQPIDFNYSSYLNQDRHGTNSDISAPSTMSYARQARQRAEEREAVALQPTKSVSPPPNRPTTSNNEEGGETDNMETEQQKGESIYNV